MGTLVVLIVAIVVAIDQSRRSPASGLDEERYHQKSAHVVYVADGDTFDIDVPDRDRSTTRIRLWGVDTPEIGHGGGTSMYFGDEAKRFAEERLRDREVFVVLSPTKSRDKYGRLLAFVYMEKDGRMFNQMLIEDGFGYADLRFDHPFDDDFLAAEKRARSERHGLWADVTAEKMPEWRQRMERKKSGK